MKASEKKIGNFKGVIPYVPRTKEALKHALKEIKLEEVEATDTLKLSKEEIHDVCLQQVPCELLSEKDRLNLSRLEVTGTITLADEETMLPVQLVIEKGVIVKIIIKGKVHVRDETMNNELKKDYPLGLVYVHERSCIKKDIVAVIAVCTDFLMVAWIKGAHSLGYLPEHQELNLLY